MANRTGFSRRNMIQAAAAMGGLALTDKVQSARLKGARLGESGLTLASQPVRLFKTADPNRERTESWAINLFVQAHEDVALTPVRMEVELFKGTRLVKRTLHDEPGVGALAIPARGITPKLPDGRSPVAPLFWPVVLRIRHSEPAAAGIDSMHIAVTLADPNAHKTLVAVTLAVETYHQKTALIYPFRGKGIIQQAGVSNGGHRNRSGQFALDGMGLTDTYGVMPVPGPGDAPSEYAGWGRAILAPADGLVTTARGDRPDQPNANTSDPAFFAPEYPNGGDPGNHVIIDHGNGEFSMIAHLQAGSLGVQAGSRVRQGDILGKLGASGDASGPHVHYQLQAGPDWQYADALPCAFSNIRGPALMRGTYFEAT